MVATVSLRDGFLVDRRALRALLPRARHQYMYWSIYKWPKKNIVMPRRAERPRQPAASRRRKHKVWITAFLYQSVQYLAKAVLSTTFVLSSILISRS